MTQRRNDQMTSNAARVIAPQVIALCRLDEAGSDQLAGWGMVLPETEKVVAYVPSRTATSTGLLETYSSLDAADRMLSYAGLYPVTDLSTLPGAPR